MPPWCPEHSFLLSEAKSSNSSKVSNLSDRKIRIFHSCAKHLAFHTGRRGERWTDRGIFEPAKALIRLLLNPALVLILCNCFYNCSFYVIIMLFMCVFSILILHCFFHLCFAQKLNDKDKVSEEVAASGIPSWELMFLMSNGGFCLVELMESRFNMIFKVSFLIRRLCWLWRQDHVLAEL